MGFKDTHLLFYRKPVNLQGLSKEIYDILYLIGGRNDEDS